jgi:hypothetical protein
VPDWTYLPLRPAAERLLGVARARRIALRGVARIASLPGGPTVIRAFDYTTDFSQTAVHTSTSTYPSPVGIVTANATPNMETALRSMGFGFVATPDTLPPEAVVTTTTDLSELARLIENGAPLVVANEAAIAHGPTVAQRVNEAIASQVIASQVLASQAPKALDQNRFGLRLWAWPGWLWAMWLGIAMVCAGIGAAIIAIGPVLLGYDIRFLGMNVAGLDGINPRLVSFLQHDRITMAGCMAAIGCNDIGFALAMRRGWRWARAGFVIAGACGFPTFFLFLGYRFFDPLHFAVAIGFFPLYLLGIFRPQVAPTWRTNLAVNESARRRATMGQLLLVTVAFGVVVSGLVIMVVGLRDVLIPSDRVYLGTTQAFMQQQLDGRLIRFIAHDRAGFGGALFSLGVGVLTMSMWGWREGERSTWWSLFAASVVGFGAAIVIHVNVGYTDTLHLLPAYLGIVMVGMALLLSREWMLTDSSPPSHN